jgi:hypothetical protein
LQAGGGQAGVLRKRRVRQGGEAFQAIVDVTTREMDDYL